MRLREMETMEARARRAARQIDRRGRRLAETEDRQQGARMSRSVREMCILTETEQEKADRARAVWAAAYGAYWAVFVREMVGQEGHGIMSLQEEERLARDAASVADRAAQTSLDERPHLVAKP